MDLDPNLLKKIIEAAAMRPLDPADIFLNSKKMAATVNDRYSMYCNPRVTKSVDSLSPSVVSHLKFVPLYESSLVVIQPAVKGEEGAVAIHRSASGKTFTVNVHAVLLGFNLDFTGRRNLSCPVTTVPVADDKSVVVMQVKSPERRPTTTRKRRPKGTDGHAAD